MKSRSSTGVGMKVDLEYNIETMRITDPGESQDSQGPIGNDILSKIKTSSATVSGGMSEQPKAYAQVEGSKLKSMLAGLKKAD